MQRLLPTEDLGEDHWRDDGRPLSTGVEMANVSISRIFESSRVEMTEMVRDESRHRPGGILGHD